MTVQDIATTIRDHKSSVILIYGFNSTGKTQLSVAYKDATKSADGAHTGVYYNAYSEDLFVWDNDIVNDGSDISLTVRPCSLNRLHALLTEESVAAKLSAFKPSYDFSFTLFDNPERGIQSISFSPKTAAGAASAIKISRGEERVFVWCFFLALFEVEGWSDLQSSHIFIDDPVSSLDDHNIFVTASTLLDLIETHHASRKIIITTHHIGLFSILGDWLLKGEKAEGNRKWAKALILTANGDSLALESCKDGILLYHLRLLQLLKKARDDNAIRAYHLALLRQVLENVSSFLGVGQFRYSLEQIGIVDAEDVTNILNVLSHKKVYYYESDMLTPDSTALFARVLDRLLEHYRFVLHMGE